jgi:hypothetical protein
VAKVRGASILGTIDYVRSTFGEGATSEVWAGLGDSTRAELGDAGSPRVLTNGWYDCGLLIELSREVDRRFGTGDLALARAAGKYCAFQDVNRFFRWLLRLSRPASLFQRAVSVFRNYHDEGVFVVEAAGADRATIRIEDWSSAGDVMCRRIEGWIERALELTLGADRGPRIHETAHLAQDAAVSRHRFCRFVAEWGAARP